MKQHVPITHSEWSGEHPEPINVPLPLLLLVGWMIPGAGHLYLKKWWKGIVLISIFFFLFIMGMVLKGPIFVPGGEDPQTYFISILGTFAHLGAGLFYFIGLLFYPVEGQITYQYYEVGMLFLLLPGIMNYLVMVDAMDIRSGKKR